LVDVARIVDNQTERERLLVLFSREVLHDVLVVDRVLVVTGVHQPVGQVSKSFDVVGARRVEVGIISNGFVSLIDDWLVDKVPGALPGVPHTFDHIRERGALDEWVISFVLRQLRIVSLQRQKHLLGFQ